MPDRLLTADFVGRRAELAVFEQAIVDARNGLPSVVLLGGDAGIGKTTIVSEAARRAGVALYLGRSTHIGGDVIPLAPLADLLRQVRRAAPGLFTVDGGPTPLQHWLAPGSVAPHLSDAPHGGLFVAMLELIARLAAEDAVVAGVEDLHWADTVTWDLFEFLARNLIDDRVVLVGSYRVNEVGIHPSQRRRLAEMSRLPAARRIHLAGLDRSDVAERVATITGSPASTALVDQVFARGQGNPFFTQELVAAHLAGETIPMVLSDLISAEIAGLDHGCRDVLETLAAIGRGASHDLLATIVPLGATDLEHAVRRAIDAQLLVVDSTTDVYRFRHPLLGEVVYADLLPPQRSRLHRRIAETLQQQSPDTLRRADRAGELAFHLDRSGNSEDAFPALLAAADAAETVAPGAAFGHLERAFELWDSVGDQSPAASRGDRLWQAADLATSTVGNERAVELARAAFGFGPPPQGAPLGHERLGRYLWASGRLEESRAEFARAEELLSGTERAEAAPVFAGLGQAALMTGDDRAAEQWCAKVFDVLPSAADDPAAWGMARRVLGIVRSNQGRSDEAIELCRESMAATTSAQGRALAAVYLCVALVDAGEHQAAIDTSLDAVAEGQLTGLDPGFGGYFDSLAAETLTRLGRWPEAATVLARHPIATIFPVGLLRLARAETMLAARQGHSDRALAQLADAEAQPADGFHRAVLDATSADVHLSLGNWDDAAAAADRGWDSAASSSALWAARFAMFSVAAAVERSLDARARGDASDLSEIVARLQQRVDAARALADLSSQRPHREIEARLAHATASLTRLTASDADGWAAAAARWIELGDRWMTAAALLRESEAAASAGAAARAASSLRRAHSIASELGAAPLLAEIDALSRRTRISVEEPARLTIDEGSAHSLGLTPREAEVLSLVAAGQTNRQIGAQLFVSDKTASVHVSNILRKLGVNSRVDAAAVAQRLGID